MTLCCDTLLGQTHPAVIGVLVHMHQCEACHGTLLTDPSFVNHWISASHLHRWNVRLFGYSLPHVISDARKTG
jgi:hypothetical protein